jgi:hypothetical protein
MFSTRGFKLWTAVAITMAALFIAGRLSFSQTVTGTITGSWQGTVTATNPPGLPPFTSLITFFQEGTTIESRRLYVPASPFGPMLETAAHGSWVHTEGNQFEVKFMFLLQSETDGSALGTDNIRLHLVLDPLRRHLTGTFESTVKDVSGNPIFSASGSYDATPIE